MFSIQTLNPISPIGLALFGDLYQLDQIDQDPHAVLVRSTKMHEFSIPESLLAVGRAGAGTNNIPIDKMSLTGIPVFNTPGANANAVKELVITGLLLVSRNIFAAWQYLQTLQGDDAQLHQLVEKNKKQFVGSELMGKTLGVVGLGHIGVMVANAACDLGMRVVGFDPAIKVENAWKLQSSVEQASSIEEAVGTADFVTVHVPLLEKTKHLIDSMLLSKFKPNNVLLNFSRSEVVDTQAVERFIQDQSLRAFVCDFPQAHLREYPQVICLPHLGASTKEAEQNCAVMVAQQVKEFLEYGHIRNSVNFPSIKLTQKFQYRLSIVNANVPNMVAQISTVLSQQQLNIVDMINKSKGDLAYTLIDVDQPLSEEMINSIKRIDGIIRVRYLTLD